MEDLLDNNHREVAKTVAASLPPKTIRAHLQELQKRLSEYPPPRHHWLEGFADDLRQFVQFEDPRQEKRIQAIFERFIGGACKEVHKNLEGDLQYLEMRTQLKMWLRKNHLCSDPNQISARITLPRVAQRLQGVLGGDTSPVPPSKEERPLSKTPTYEKNDKEACVDVAAGGLVDSVVERLPMGQVIAIDTFGLRPLFSSLTCRLLRIDDPAKMDAIFKAFMGGSRLSYTECVHLITHYGLISRTESETLWGAADVTADLQGIIGSLVAEVSLMPIHHPHTTRRVAAGIGARIADAALVRHIQRFNQSGIVDYDLVSAAEKYVATLKDCVEDRNRWDISRTLRNMFRRGEKCPETPEEHLRVAELFLTSLRHKMAEQEGTVSLPIVRRIVQEFKKVLFLNRDKE